MNTAVDDSLIKMLALVERGWSLMQPWATLVSVEAKRFETRSRAVNYRGPVAIHASLGFPTAYRQLCYQQPFAGALARAGYNSPDDLPLGKVLSVVRIIDCVSTNYYKPARHTDEYQFGNYSADRFAIHLDNVVRLKPFPAKGMLGLWRLQRPITLEDLA